MEDQILARAARLRDIRGRFFDTAKNAALALGVAVSTYAAHEKGTRGIKDAELELYARRFRVSLPWLAFGEGEPNAHSTFKVPVVGLVGAGAEIDVGVEQVPLGGFYDIDTVFRLPRGSVGFEVIGDSMYPRYDAGDVVICQASGQPIAELRDGAEAAVLVEDGRRFLKKIYRQPDGTFTLESHNAPPIRGVRLTWASDVMFIIPVGRWSKVASGRTPSSATRGK